METLRKYAWILGIVGGVLVLTFLGSYAALQTIQTGFGVVGGIGGELRWELHAPTRSVSWSSTATTRWRSSCAT